LNKNSENIHLVISLKIPIEILLSSKKKKRKKKLELREKKIPLKKFL
jgi:hypothetical protein